MTTSTTPKGDERAARDPLKAIARTPTITERGAPWPR